jgi:hypothetical protein
MNKISMLMLIALTSFVSNSYAVTETNGCGYLSIIITNATPVGCNLVSSNLKHGYYKYTSSVPTYIPPYSSASPLFLTQSIFGPELELSYACGQDQFVTFTSRQNLCILAAGEVSGEILAIKNMYVTFQATYGSWFWSENGSIIWRLQ